MPAQDNTDKGLREEVYEKVYHGLTMAEADYYTDWIMGIVARQVQAATTDAVSHIMMQETEGLFDHGDLFIKRAPIEQACIDLLGYESYKAITEAATAAQQAAAPTTAEGEIA